MATEFNGFKPRLNMKGFVQIPNEFFDELPNISSLSELKVLLAVFRKTYGWVSHIDPETGQPVYKEEDAISMSQFKDLTGLSGPSCVDGVKRGLEHGYLERVKEGTFHGGDSSQNESAVYRIRQEGETPPPVKPRLPDTIKEITGTLPAKSVQDVVFNDDSEEDPADILAEFFPKSQEEAPKKKESKSFKTKDMNKWNANDLLAYFNTQYRTALGFGAGPITMKDKSLSKKLLEGYDTSNLVKAIDYYIQNYKTISYLPSGHPTFNIFFGYRKSLIPEALDPSGKKKTSGGGQNKVMREFDEEDKGGGYEW